MSSTAVADTSTATNAAPETKEPDAAEIARLLPNAVGDMELRLIDVDLIDIPEGRHRRRSRRGKDQLGQSMEAIGLDTPLLVSPKPDGRFRLVAGGGRLQNAKEKGWTTIHAVVKIRDERAAAASAAAENMARADLSPAEEADAIEHMIKAGDTPRGAAEKVGLTPQTGTLRMALVELPEAVRSAFHFDGLPPSLAAQVKGLYDGNNAIGLEVAALAKKNPEEVARALNRGLSEFFRTMRWQHRDLKLAGQPPFVVGFHRGSDEGRSMSWSVTDPGRIKIKGKAAKWFTELSEKATYGHQRPKIVLSEEDLDMAAAMGLAYHSPGEHGNVWIHDRKWLTDHVSKFVLPRMQAEAEAKVSDTALAKAKKAVKSKVAIADMTPEQLAPTLKRRFMRELQPKAHGANESLGLAITSKLGVTKLTREHALFFAFEVLGRERTGYDVSRSYEQSARRVAECAARVMSDWIKVETTKLKSGKTKTKVTYLEGLAAEKRMWEYIRAAESPEEILQRVLHMYAAAATFKRECGANGKEPLAQTPENAVARAALEKLVKPVVPMAVKRIDRELREYDALSEARKAIAEAKAERDAQGTVAEERDTPAPRAPASKRNELASTRKRYAERAVEVIEGRPGITIPQLAQAMNLKQNYLQRMLHGLELQGRIKKKGRGWHLAGTGAATGHTQQAKAA